MDETSTVTVVLAVTFPEEINRDDYMGSLKAIKVDRVVSSYSHENASITQRVLKGYLGDCEI